MLKVPERRNDIRIAFVQPAYAKYRQPLFEKLDRYFNLILCFEEDSRVYLQSNHSEMFTSAHQLRGMKQKKNLPVYPARKYLKLLLFLMKHNYSVVITSTSLSPETIISLFLSKVKRSKCVLWTEDWFMPKLESLISRFRLSLVIFLQKFVLKSVDAVVVEGTAQYKYARALNISDEKLFFSNHCSLDYSKYSSKNLKKKLKIENGLVVLYLGRIVQSKGLDILIRAFSKIERERNDIFLVVCGDGDFRSFCEHLADGLKIKHVIFLGMIPKEEIASYYKTADVFVLPSCVRAHQGVMVRALAPRAHVEGWGLVVNEAMSMAKPIITTDAVGAAQDLVKNGVNGYVVKNGDVDELYLALKKILEDRKLRKVMEKNSRRMFEEFNDFDKMFEGFRRAIEYAIE